MTQVVGLELDVDFFKSDTAAMDYLKTCPVIEVRELHRITGFSLRKNNCPKILTPEKPRKVYQWNQFYGSHEGFKIVRPISTVAIAIATGPRFTATELPTKLPSTIQRETDKVERHKARMEQKRLEREAKKREDQKNGVPEKETKKKGKRKSTSSVKVVPMGQGAANKRKKRQQEVAAEIAVNLGESVTAE